jgi:hypothetical protein
MELFKLVIGNRAAQRPASRARREHRPETPVETKTNLTLNARSLRRGAPSRVHAVVSQPAICKERKSLKKQIRLSNIASNAPRPLRRIWRDGSCEPERTPDRAITAT